MIILSSSILLFGLSCWTDAEPTKLHTTLRPSRNRKSIDSDPCLAYGQFTGVHTIKFPRKYGALDKPWQRTDVNPKLYSSEGLIYQWMWVKNLPVRGLGEVTIEDVIRFLDSEGCFFLVWGSVVRDTIMMRQPTRIEGEVNCDLENLQEACFKRYGVEKCIFETLDNGDSVLLIGDSRASSSAAAVAHPLSIYEWNSTFNIDAQKWDFTINTLAIFDNQAGDVVVIDPTGRGMDDLCERTIAPAIDDWNWWSQGGLEKIFRYFHLRSLGFRDSNSGLHHFIANKIISDFDAKAIQEVYCIDVLDGGFTWAGEGMVATCHLTEPEGDKKRRIKEARRIMSTELGDFWTRKVYPEIEKLEAIFVTERQVDLVKHGPRSDRRVSVAVNRIESRAKTNRTVTSEGKNIYMKKIRPMTDFVETSEEGDDKHKIGGFVENNDVDISKDEDSVNYEDEMNTPRPIMYEYGSSGMASSYRSQLQWMTVILLIFTLFCFL